MNLAALAPAQIAPSAETYFTRGEAAEYLKLGTSTLAKLDMRGEGPTAIRIGRAVRYRQRDLDAFMAARVRA